jgi:hypothetical protein
MLRRSRAGFSRVSISPNGGLVLISFALQPQLTLMNTSKHKKLQKKFARSSFHIQEITPGTIVFRILNNITIMLEGENGGKLHAWGGGMDFTY